MITVKPIDENSPHLEAVKRLWRAHSDTLGFMPAGAFADYAHERHIAVALRGDECVGYLLYRIVREKATIAHFCVAPEARKQGYARALLNWLIEVTKKQRGILLSCRKDFDAANRTWERLGFHPIGEKAGRGDGTTLIIWWQSHGHKDLFTEAEPPGELEAVVDANVFFDLADKNNDESMGLVADWLRPFVTICYTPELLIEIDRNPDSVVRKQRRLEAKQFKLLESSAESFCNAEQILRPLFPVLKSPQDESDFRQLVRALAAEADVFVTRDKELLDKADAVYKHCNLSIVRPGELAAQIDTLQREQEYHRNQVAGTRQIFQSRIASIDDGLISAIKLNHERHSELVHPLNRYLVDPHRFHLFKIADADGTTLAAYVVDRHEGVDRIPLFRVCDKRRGATIARALLTGLVNQAVKVGSKAVLITDSSVNSAACTELGFLPTQNGRLKLVLSGWLAIDDIPDLLVRGEPIIDELAMALRNAKTDPVTASELEHLLRPAKLSDSALPSFIVPIQPRFAEHLFDGRLASGSLFGADVDLALNPESAYYRSARPAIVTCPARVLWYVSKDDRYPGTMSIRACSRIVEVVKGTPKALFQRFRRLGVYEWPDVLETAGSIDKDIMAFRFDDSELFPPVPWATFQRILKSHGIKTNFESPVSIPAIVFGEIYAAALDPPQVC